MTLCNADKSGLLAINIFSKISRELLLCCYRDGEWKNQKVVQEVQKSGQLC